MAWRREGGRQLDSLEKKRSQVGKGNNKGFEGRRLRVTLVQTHFAMGDML